MQIDELVRRARNSQRVLEQLSQEQVDEIVRAIGKVVFDNAQELARMTLLMKLKWVILTTKWKSVKINHAIFTTLLKAKFPVEFSIKI